MFTNSRQTKLVALALSSVAAIAVACKAEAQLPSPNPGLTPTPVVVQVSASPMPSLAATSAPPSATPVTIEDQVSGTSYRIPLTIRHVLADSAIVYFELDRPSDGLVILQSLDQGPSSQQVIPFDSSVDPSVTQQQITISGLSANTEYQVAVAIKASEGHFQLPGYGGAAWGNVTFRTASDQYPVKVGVVGDSGMGDAVTPQLAERMADLNPDFVIHTGDVVYKIAENNDPYQAFMLKFYRPFQPVLQRMPIYPVVGNHDVEKATFWEGKPFYYRAFPPLFDPRFEPSTFNGRNQWYAFAYGAIQFLMLDTQAFYEEGGRAEQTAWLQQRLQDTRFTVNIPVFHMPPYSAGLHEFDGLPVRSDWQPLFEQYGVRLVLTGHDHNYQRLVSNGITYIVSGGGSATLYKQQNDLPESQFFARRSHFVYLELYPERADLKAIDANGEVIEQLSIPLH